RARDRDLLLFASPEVFRRDIENAVGVDVERHFDLGQAARRGGKALQVEYAEKLVIPCHFALALRDLDLHRRLIVSRGREDLGLARWDGGVALDELGGNAAQGLDAER